MNIYSNATTLQLTASQKIVKKFIQPENLSSGNERESQKGRRNYTYKFSPMTSATTEKSDRINSQENWKIKLLYDGECPLCVREVNFLTQKDGGRGIVKFVDIADPNYNPLENGGVDFVTAMGVIHAVLPDDTVIKNVEVFRQVYEELGMGWVYAITKVPVVGKVADWLYGVWANWRLKITGRPEIETIITQRQQKLNSSDSCRCRLN